MQLENFGSTQMVTNGNIELFSAPLTLWFGLRSTNREEVILLFKDRFEYWDDYGFRLRVNLPIGKDDED